VFDNLTFLTTSFSLVLSFDPQNYFSLYYVIMFADEDIWICWWWDDGWLSNNDLCGPYCPYCVLYAHSSPLWFLFSCSPLDNSLLWHLPAPFFTHPWTSREDKLCPNALSDGFTNVIYTASDNSRVIYFPKAQSMCFICFTGNNLLLITSDDDDDEQYMKHVSLV